MKVTEYRVVETQVVTDEALTRILNEETKKGWIFDGMTFVPNEASKRPKMAFVIFAREALLPSESPDAPGSPGAPGAPGAPDADA